MLSRSMAIGGIGISSTPGEDGNAIDNQIASPNQPRTERVQNGEDEQRLVQRRSRRVTAFPLLGFTRNAYLAIFAHRQTTSQGEGRPGLQPVVHILIGQAPQRTQEGNKQQGFFAVRSWGSTWTGGQGRRTPMVSQTHCHPAQTEQVQGTNKGQGIDVQSCSVLGLHTMICWGRHWCLIGHSLKYHKLISIARERASPGISLPSSVKLRNALTYSQKTWE